MPGTELSWLRIFQIDAMSNASHLHLTHRMWPAFGPSELGINTGGTVGQPRRKPIKRATVEECRIICLSFGTFLDLAAAGLLKHLQLIWVCE